MCQPARGRSNICFVLNHPAPGVSSDCSSDHTLSTFSQSQFSTTLFDKGSLLAVGAGTKRGNPQLDLMAQNIQVNVLVNSKRYHSPWQSFKNCQIPPSSGQNFWSNSRGNPQFDLMAQTFKFTSESTDIFSSGFLSLPYGSLDIKGRNSGNYHVFFA